MSEKQQEILSDAIKSLLDTDKSTCTLTQFRRTPDSKPRPMLTFNLKSRYPFSIGLPKARIFLKHQSAIRKFVETNGASTT